MIYTVIGIVILIIILYLLLSWLFSTSVSLTSMQSGTVKQQISSSKISGTTSNYSYSLWFYVEDWNYKYGDEKVILERSGKDGVSECPKISLAPRENDILLDLALYSDKLSDHSQHNSVVKNFPLQKWVNLIISIYNKTLDIYIDGKLVKTELLPGIAKPCTSSDVLITPNGGFQGWTTKFEYWPHSLNPQEAYNVYKSGFSSNLFGNLFSKYKVKIAFMDNNTEDASFTF